MLNEGSCGRRLTQTLWNRQVDAEKLHTEKGTVPFSTVPCSTAGNGFLGFVTIRRARRLSLEAHSQGDACGSRDGRMGVHIAHPFQRLSREARRIEVVDVRHRGVQEVEHLERDGDAPV